MTGLTVVAAGVAVVELVCVLLAVWRLGRLRRELARSRYAATHDGLTGLVNRVGLAGRLRALLAGAGVAARLGGDEFAALVPAGDPVAVAWRCAVALAVPVILPDGTRVAVSASVGLAWAGGDGLAAGLARADAAMYRAKTTGSGVAVFDPGRDDRPSVAGDPRPAGRVRDLPTQPAAWEVAA